ncbi:uncharacterized protein CPUR_05474 [Claviceps purpurea 20.1]|uniref:Uncharacterized protein n=1 Tax=Claviceps purpurea (strain 20.1) TaxID=1111077 RepID=M1W284_CLAP2|nr:uncharacterized protein CPUR_05474 [Claviceps purpurea 20.1]
MTCDRTLSDAEFEDGTDVFEDGTDVVAEIEYDDGDEFSHATLNLHLLSAYVVRFRARMHPEAICAETVHFASAIPDFPISAENGFAYLIDTRGIDKDDLAEPWNVMNTIQYYTTRDCNGHRLSIPVGYACATAQIGAMA